MNKSQKMSLEKDIKKAGKLISSQPPGSRQAIQLLKRYYEKRNTPWQVEHLMGVASLQDGKVNKGIDLLKKAVEKGSRDIATFLNLSAAYYTKEEYERSVQSALVALKVDPNSYEGWKRLGEAKLALGSPNEALQCYQKCNQLDPTRDEIAVKIAQVYRDQGHTEKALDMYEIALKMNPSNIQGRIDRVGLLMQLRLYDVAELEIEKGLKNNPSNVHLEKSKADLFTLSGNYAEALQLYEGILARHPDLVAYRLNYASLLQDMGSLEEAERQFYAVYRERPDLITAYSSYLFVQHYNPDRTAKELFEAHLEWDRQYRPKHVERAVPADKNPARPLRIGLLSGGFRKHPVGWMIVGGLEYLPENEFSLYFYSTTQVMDELSRRLHRISTEWRMINGVADEKVNQMIREDKIDILIELSGHTEGGRLKMVALEPAPVIIKWVGGLINTTGLKAVDYLLSDHIETPEGSDLLYTEKLIRMPDDYILFTPPEYAPEVSESPTLQNGFITLGCFNNPVKVNETILEKWASLMKEIPESRLFLKSKQFGNESINNRIISTMAQNGIDRNRLIFEGYSPHKELLEAYNRVDIALDPWPYSGGLTTCEALWMGVPVITCPGPTFAGRHAASHVHNAGFPEWIAESWEEYFRKVKDLASDREKLAELRAGLRDKVARSPLCDNRRFAANLRNALREVWKIKTKTLYSDAQNNGKEGVDTYWRKPISLSPASQDEIESIKRHVGFYSQFGEDRKLNELLNPAENHGFYVDVGAFDPVTYSNTARLYELGWNGVNIDANPQAIEKFKRMRERDVNISTAIAESNGEKPFYYAEDLGEVNTLSEKHLQKWEKEGVKFEKRIVPTRRLSDLLDECLTENQPIDFMNIDVEEAEMGVLRSNDWVKYRPRLIAIETHGLNPVRPEDHPVAAYLLGKGYRFECFISPTSIFIDSKT